MVAHCLCGFVYTHLDSIRLMRKKARCSCAAEVVRRLRGRRQKVPPTTGKSAVRYRRGLSLNFVTTSTMSLLTPTSSTRAEQHIRRHKREGISYLGHIIRGRFSNKSRSFQSPLTHLCPLTIRSSLKRLRKPATHECFSRSSLSLSEN